MAAPMDPAVLKQVLALRERWAWALGAEASRFVASKGSAVELRAARSSAGGACG
jgi:hypothetical protein